MRSYIKLFCCCLALSLSACAEIVVKQVDYATPPTIADDADPAPIKFSKLRFLLPPGTEIGLESGMGPALLGGFCSWGNYPVSRTILNRKFEQQYLERTFESALESEGYDVTNNIDLDYDYEDEQTRAEYFITARVKDVDLDLCKRGRFTFFNIFNTAEGAKGKIYARIDWSVYNALTRSVVYKTSTEGYSRRDYPNSEGLELLFMDAFEMAAYNLGADKGFYNLIVKGIKPPKPADTHDTTPLQSGDEGWEDTLTLPKIPLNTQPFENHAEKLRLTTVTIQKSGHGSGFFISKEGHILTNAHVVGNARRMRVILADKKRAITADVLRVDKARDVALLKLEHLPKSYDIQVLPIQTTQPAVSKTIYAIGSPQHYSTMENTVTKGIVSNHRKLKSAGKRLNFIQGDVTIHGGNSGGPLLDEYGNIVGISDLIYNPNPGKRGINLNLFIPIAEALHALNIDIAQ